MADEFSNAQLNLLLQLASKKLGTDPETLRKALEGENAEAFINFLCRPDIAQKNCEAIWYSTPNTEAIKLMGEEYTSNTTMNPSAEDVANCEYFHDIQDFIAIYNALWQEVKNAK